MNHSPAALQVIGRIRPAKHDKQKIIEEKKKMILGGGAPDPGCRAAHARNPACLP